MDIFGISPYYPFFSWSDTSPLHWSQQNKYQDRAKAIFWIIPTRVGSMQNAWYEDQKIENPDSECEWMKLAHFYGCVALWRNSKRRRRNAIFHEFAIVLKFAVAVPLQRNRHCSSPSVWRNFCGAQCEDEERAKLEKWVRVVAQFSAAAFWKRWKSCNSVRTAW